MKIKSGYMLREVAGHHVVLPLGSRVVEFNGVITLNETGSFIWKNMEFDISANDLVNKITVEFNIDANTAENDLREFVAILNDKNLLEQGMAE